MDFVGKKVVVMGLGLHGGGVGVTKWLLSHGAHVTVTDLKTRKELAPSIRALRSYSLSEAKRTRRYSVRFVLGRHNARDFASADLIVQNPGVPNDAPYLKLARKHRIPITNDTALFFEHCPWPIIGVTGTKGKTTTATLLYEILRRHQRKVALAGNLRVSPLELLLNTTHNSVILELSSWNLEGLERIKKSPHVAVITNIMPDHLNRYRSMTDYIKAKSHIFLYQKRDDILVLNRDNPITRGFAKRAKARVVWFSKKSPPNDIIRTVARTSVLRGQHNLENVAAAYVAAKALGVADATIRKTFRSFKGVPGRQELVRTMNGIRYINDTTATTPEATIAALETVSTEAPTVQSQQLAQRTLRRRIVLIAGGGDKNLDYRALAPAIQKHVKAIVLFKGSASAKLLASLRGAARRSLPTRDLPKGDNPELVSNITTMRAALTAARRFATRGDAILLSPGATSFGLFAHEFDRGDQFILAVKKLRSRSR